VVGTVGCQMHRFCVYAAWTFSFEVLFTFDEFPSSGFAGFNNFFDVLIGVSRPLCQDTPEG